MASPPPIDEAVWRQTLARNRAAVLERIAAAARRAGRDPAAVRLLAVTKALGTEAVAALVEMGQQDIGESRLEALERKRAALAARGLAPRWHMVGHVQRRKLPRLLACAPALVHSLDSMRLLEALERRLAAAAGASAHPPPPLAVLLEVNVSGETTKYGFAPEQLQPALARLAGSAYLRACGLMTMAPLVADPEQTRPVFAALRALGERLRQQHPGLVELSMGMSNDFEVAVEEGATIVRVGTALARGLPAAVLADTGG
ncbi:MAG: YggS family pyridoxal phosphate enzyme [Planctomycetota bacterium]|nr:MAG: YggS family pyridoxal phosphate enzyme [Planctomycetota bacterium]